jgi:hypothetical protein
MRNNVFLVDDDDDFRTILDNGVSEIFEETPDLPLEYTDDPLALSCASYRKWTESHWHRWARLGEIADTIDERDRVMAQNIRDYYSSKLTFARLSNIPFTRFQEILADFLINKRTLKQSEQGVLYCLPYFYVEDCQNDWVFENTTTVSEKISEDPFPTHITVIGLELTPLREVYAFRKTGEKYVFWFKTRENEPVAIEIKTGNTLLPLFRSIFKRPSVKFNGTARVVSLGGARRNSGFYKLNQIEFVE